MKTLALLFLASLFMLFASGCSTLRAMAEAKLEYDRTHPTYVCETDEDGNLRGGYGMYRYSGTATTTCRQR